MAPPTSYSVSHQNKWLQHLSHKGKSIFRCITTLYKLLHVMLCVYFGAGCGCSSVSNTIVQCCSYFYGREESSWMCVLSQSRMLWQKISSWKLSDQLLVDSTHLMSPPDWMTKARLLYLSLNDEGHLLQMSRRVVNGYWSRNRVMAWMDFSCFVESSSVPRQTKTPLTGSQ